MQQFCGTDIIEVERIKTAIISTNGFKEKIFTENEIEYAEHKSDIIKFQHYAGRFAAKEAIYKSLSKIDNTLNFSDIEILNDATSKNRPIVNILNHSYISILIGEQKLLIDVSISHIKDYAIANSFVTLM